MELKMTILHKKHEDTTESISQNHNQSKNVTKLAILTWILDAEHLQITESNHKDKRPEVRHEQLQLTYWLWDKNLLEWLRAWLYKLQRSTVGSIAFGKME